MDRSGQTAPEKAPGIERPLRSNTTAGWGSDIIAEMIRALGIPYVALNPGASYRGLHDSLVNHLGNETPQILLCLHEENAVAIAHGWAKVTDKPMLALVHSNVGLMHATMALYNAYGDRVPMIVLGATGPVDPMKRRPWVDWIHTSKDQGALIRDFVKWDDQPTSIGGAFEALFRAKQIAETKPFGPTYVCFDTELQEAVRPERPVLPENGRFAAPRSAPSAELIEQAAAALHAAERPVILIGRVSRSEAGWTTRVKLAEALGAIVFSDRKQATSFPTWHHLNGSSTLAAQARPIGEGIRDSDAVLSLDFVDLGTALRGGFGPTGPVTAKVIHTSLEQSMANGFNNDLWSLPPVDINIYADADETAEALLVAVKRLGPRQEPAWRGRAVPDRPADPEAPDSGSISVPYLAATLRKIFKDRDRCLIRTPISWAEHMWDANHPLDYLGLDGAGGLGSAPGMAVGAALALRDSGSGRFPLTVFGDGEFMMGMTAIWTGVHYRVPCLMVVSNNRSYYNDELHQERVAQQRGRPVENKWIGQHIGDPDLDLAMMARAQGAAGLGPVRAATELEAVLREGVELVEQGKFVVIDVRVDPGSDAGVRTAIAGRSP